MHLVCTKRLLRTEIGASAGAVDKFKPRFHVPTNPEGVILNLDNPSTTEGMPMQNLLHGEATFAAAVGAGPGSGLATVTCGVGGVGKLCSLRGIGHHTKVKKRFTWETDWVNLSRMQEIDRYQTHREDSGRIR